MEKTMKKNKMMRAASAVMVATLVSTCAFSGVLAKYTSNDKADDTARVAKWGVVLQTEGNLFGDTYKDAQVLNDNSELTVQAADANGTKEGADVVAPGTKSEDPFSITLKGTPEVDSKVSATIKEANIFLGKGTWGQMVEVPEKVVTEANFNEFNNTTTTKLFVQDGSDYKPATKFESSARYYTLEDVTDELTGAYYPVVYKLDGTEGYGDGNTTADSLDEVAKLIAKKLNNGTDVAGGDRTDGVKEYKFTSEVYDANTNLAEKLKVKDLGIKWSWEFSKDAATDKKDTILGLLNQKVKNGSDIIVVKQTDASANTWTSTLTDHTDYNLDTSFDIEITVDQVD